jgi:hypothetical protein
MAPVTAIPVAAQTLPASGVAPGAPGAQAVPMAL